MSKVKSRFVCQKCGYETLKWLGRCPDCGSWNTLVEERVQESAPGKGQTLPKEAPLSILSADARPDERFSSGFSELDRVLGGGIVPGSVVLVAGDPGIGKSTLLLQLADRVASQGFTVLYVSGEESSRQVSLRARRLGLGSEKLMVVSETNMEAIEQHVTQVQPNLMVIDSIQTMWVPQLESSPGSVSQIRESAAQLVRMAKLSGCAIFVVGHVTKSGVIAGPRVLEHMVDTVLYFEGERNHSFRILRGVKNRFGSTNEIGIFEMGDSGLAQVMNPSAFFLSDRASAVQGVAVAASMEGTRPILVEIEALVTRSTYGNPRRVAIGVDYNRVAIILAVLEKRVGLFVSGEDVYVSVAGGLKLDDPASDLAVASAIASSFRGHPISASSVLIGEIGLTGELRSVSRIEPRIMEAARLGFKRCIIPCRNLRTAKALSAQLEILGAETVSQALEYTEGGTPGAGR